jgi:DtxR family Mn-dependent transcriptional regulator
MTGNITISKEDYLKAILEAESEGLSVIPATLAHWLAVSPPAVTMAVRRLKRDGYVDMKADGIVRLTAKGKETAYRTALRHHLIERMLSEIFGMEWHEIHSEAGNSVLPESPAQRRKRGAAPLSEATEDADYTVASIYERDPALLLFLHKRGIGPGAKVRVVSRNYDETLALKTPKGAATLGRPAAERVWVKPLRVK